MMLKSLIVAGLLGLAPMAHAVEITSGWLGGLIETTDVLWSLEGPGFFAYGDSTSVDPWESYGTTALVNGVTYPENPFAESYGSLTFTVPPQPPPDMSHDGAILDIPFTATGTFVISEEISGAPPILTVPLTGSGFLDAT
jgi:hypothetical protein